MNPELMIIQRSTERLKRARQAAGMTQAALAELIGSNAPTISRWESGSYTTIPRVAWQGLSKALGAPIPYLMGFDADEELFTPLYRVDGSEGAVRSVNPGAIVAVETDADMSAIWPTGSVAWVHPMNTPAHGDYVAYRTSDGRVLVRQYENWSGTVVLRARSHDPAAGGLLLLPPYSGQFLGRVAQITISL